MTKKWIQEATRNHKKGALHRQLGLSENEIIDTRDLETIIKSKLGDYFITENHRIRKKIKVTKLLKRRVNFALNVRR